MSSPNQARRVTAQIFFQGADITGSMRPYFLSATYTDKEADGTDDLQLKLQDRDDIWLKKWLADAIDAAASAGSLSASSKAKTDGAAKSYKVTAKSGLNVRSGPSTSYGKYGALVCGAELQVEGIENGWAKVSYNGKTAYVSASYIKESGGGGGDASAAAPASASGAGFKISAVFVRENWTGGGRDKVLDCGQFELDSVDASGPPNTITIKAEKDTTANVTIKDTNIRTDSAAIKTEGEGNVNLNVEGTNTVSSGDKHAGVEKSNGGKLTIGSESGEGKLTANGGHGGAGIGGGYEGSGSDITITGGEITANGGGEAAGIGGGVLGSGSDITITGGEVTANGGWCGAGIGGGPRGNGSDITISGGKVIANGGLCGAGIGGGYKGSGSDVTISKDSRVEATGGDPCLLGGYGAAIGGGGYNTDTGNQVDGSEIEPDTSGLYTTGKVERVSGDGTVLETITGTVEPPVEPEKSTAEEPAAREPLYRVTDLEGKNLPYQVETADGVLSLTASADGAILTGTLRALGYLQNQGIEKITFTDGTHTATIVLADLIAKGEAEAVYVLTLGAENTLTLNGEAIDF